MTPIKCRISPRHDAHGIFWYICVPFRDDEWAETYRDAVKIAIQRNEEATLEQLFMIPDLRARGELANLFGCK